MPVHIKKTLDRIFYSWGIIGSADCLEIKSKAGVPYVPFHKYFL